MHQFEVPDMTCGHCASTIARALRTEDPAAKVEVSLGEHLVKVESKRSAAELGQCIVDAGYTPKLA
jgi:copper chaperone